MSEDKDKVIRKLKDRLISVEDERDHLALEVESLQADVHYLENLNKKEEEKLEIAMDRIAMYLSDIVDEMRRQTRIMEQQTKMMEEHERVGKRIAEKMDEIIIDDEEDYDAPTYWVPTNN